MRNTITVTIYCNSGREIEAKFPARWHICPACEGNATSTRWIEPDGGGFTASEWQEACDDDPDYGDDEPGFATKYFSGYYDRPCEPCHGKGRILVLDRDAITGWRQTILMREYEKQERDSHEIDAMHEAERRYGA